MLGLFNTARRDLVLELVAVLVGYRIAYLSIGELRRGIGRLGGSIDPDIGGVLRLGV